MIYYNDDVIEKVFAWEVFGVNPVTDPGWRVDLACPTRTGRGGAFPKREEITLWELTMRVSENSACPTMTGRGRAYPQRKWDETKRNNDLRLSVEKGQGPDLQDKQHAQCTTRN